MTELQSPCQCGCGNAYGCARCELAPHGTPALPLLMRRYKMVDGQQYTIALDSEGRAWSKRPEWLEFHPTQVGRSFTPHSFVTLTTNHGFVP